MQERWLSVEEVAEHLGVNPDTIYNWVDRREMPARKLDRLWKFLASPVDSWVMASEAAKGTPLPTENALRAKRSHA
jgi:excisionase family DNA binding protein